MPERDSRQEQPTASLKSRGSSGIAWGVVDSIGQQALSLGVFIVLGRILTPEVFGVVSTALVFVYFLRGGMLNAIATSLVALPRPADDDYDTGFCLLLAISGSAFLILNAAALPLARLYGLPEMQSVVHGTSLMVLTIGLSNAHMGWARKNFRFRSLAIRNVLGVLAGGTAGIALALMGFGIAALVANQVVMSTVALVLMWLFIPWRPRLRASAKAARRILRNAVPLGMSQGLLFLVQNFDTAVVTYLLGPFSGGLYAIAKRISLAIQLSVSHPIAAVTLPAFSEVMDDDARLSRAITVTCALVMAITAPIYIATAVVSPLFIDILFGDKWAASAPILTLLCLTGIVLPGTGVLHTVIVARGRPRRIFYFALIQIVLAIAALWLFSPQTPEAVALCLTVPYVAVYGLSVAAAYQLARFPLPAFAAGIAKPLIAGAAMAAAMILLPDIGQSMPDLLAKLAVGAAAYLAVLGVIARNTLKELLSFARALVRR